MTSEQVKATVTVKSENFTQALEESVAPSSSSSSSGSGASYEQLIAANERLRASLSKILTEFVEKARATAQQSNGDQKKRKLKCNFSFAHLVLRSSVVFSWWWQWRCWFRFGQSWRRRGRQQRGRGRRRGRGWRWTLNFVSGDCFFLNKFHWSALYSCPWKRSIQSCLRHKSELLTSFCW